MFGVSQSSDPEQSHDAWRVLAAAPAILLAAVPSSFKGQDSGMPYTPDIQNVVMSDCSRGEIKEIGKVRQALDSILDYMVKYIEWPHQQSLPQPLRGQILERVKEVIMLNRQIADRDRFMAKTFKQYGRLQRPLRDEEPMISRSCVTCKRSCRRAQAIV